MASAAMQAAAENWGRMRGGAGTGAGLEGRENYEMTEAHYGTEKGPEGSEGSNLPFPFARKKEA